MFTLKLFFCGQKNGVFQKISPRKYSGSNRTLIVKNFEFIAEFLDQTGWGGRDNKGQFALICQLV